MYASRPLPHFINTTPKHSPRICSLPPQSNPCSPPHLSRRFLPISCATSRKDELLRPRALHLTIGAFPITQGTAVLLPPSCHFLLRDLSFCACNYWGSVVKGALSGGYGARPVISSEVLLQKPCIGRDITAGIGLLRGYLTSVRADKAIGVGSHLSHWRFLLANPNFRRFFSSGSPKKKSIDLWMTFDFFVLLLSFLVWQLFI